MAAALFTLSLLLISGAATAAPSSKKIPDFIHICKQNDPKLDQCIVDSIEFLRPYLRKGIPELDMPAIEPLHIDEMKVTESGPLIITGRDIKVHGAGDFNIEHLEIDRNETVTAFHAKISFPHMRVEAKYEMEGAILSLPLNGKGDFSANASDILVEVTTYGQRVKRKDKTFLHFLDGIIKVVRVQNIGVRLDNLFNGDKTLGDATNAALNANTDEVFKLTRPDLEIAILRFCLDASNKVFSKYPLEILMPAE